MGESPRCRGGKDRGLCGPGEAPESGESLDRFYYSQEKLLCIAFRFAAF